MLPPLESPPHRAVVAVGFAGSRSTSAAPPPSRFAAGTPVSSPVGLTPTAAFGLECRSPGRRIQARVGVMEFGWALRRPMRLPDSPRHERGLPAALRGVGVKPEVDDWACCNVV
uniref:Uncharacterized protein n=1 Tax=Oryza nivara TaxID=4536 RepID=A0A679BDE4_ORYNI|nr:hypothetical protein [Oryza sativa f. spontanea]